MAWSDRDTTLYDELPVKLADEYDSAGKRLTAVSKLINETLAGDVRIAALAAAGAAAAAQTWEAVARDLARQVIDAEAELSRWGEEDKTDLDDAAKELVLTAGDLADVEKERDQWMTWYWEVAAKRDALAIRRQEEEQAHCDTYVEAVRLAKQLRHMTTDTP